MHEILFNAKKIITPFLTPPGILIVLLLLSGILLLRSRARKIGTLNCVLGLMLWMFSITPFSDILLSNLEKGLTIPAKVTGDAIVVLGGGVHGSVRDISGTGVVSEDTVSRLVTAARLDRKVGIPVILSGGSIYKDTAPESQVMKRLLADLGIPEKKIIVEDKSRDTVENARFSVELCRKYGFRRIFLVTSSYHMERAIMAFRKYNVEVTPFPAYVQAKERRKYRLIDFLPSASAMLSTSNAVKEYLGLLFYKISS